MKVKEFVTKYRLNETSHFNREDFVSDFHGEYLKMVSASTGKNGVSVGQLENIIEFLHTKFMNIFNGSCVSKESADKFWNFIYAAVIIPERNKLYPDWKEAKLKYRCLIDPDFKRRYEGYLHHKEMEKKFGNDWGWL
jgi:hypothetical protein